MINRVKSHQVLHVCKFMHPMLQCGSLEVVPHILHAAANHVWLRLLLHCSQSRDLQRLEEQKRGAAILQEQLAARQRQRLREDELRDQVRATACLLAGCDHDTAEFVWSRQWCGG